MIGVCVCVLFILQDYMPFRGVYVSAFENELDYSHALLQTATSLQTNKFIQVTLRESDQSGKVNQETN